MILPRKPKGKLREISFHHDKTDWLQRTVPIQRSHFQDYFLHKAGSFQRARFSLALLSQSYRFLLVLKKLLWAWLNRLVLLLSSSHFQDSLVWWLSHSFIQKGPFPHTLVAFQSVHAQHRKANKTILSYMMKPVNLRT